MIEFDVAAMSCDHCVKAVTDAVHGTDPQAHVQVDLPTHKVRIESTAPRQALVEALAEAGYDAT